MPALHLWLAGLLCPGLILVACAADDVPKPAAPPPPYKRLLQGADRRKAKELQAQVDRAWAAGRFEEALTPAQALLALRLKVQGDNHWQVMDARQLMAGIQRILKQDEASRHAMAGNPARSGRAEGQEARGRYRDAEPVRRQILDLCRRVLGEDHSATAGAYIDLAVNLRGQVRLAAAEPFFRKALDIDRKVLGEKHPTIARIYNDLAQILIAQSKPAAAEPLAAKALAICRSVLGEDDRETSAAYNTLAYSFNVRGNYAAAQSLMEKALAINRKVLGEDHADTAAAYNNLAVNLDAQAKYAEAQPMYEKALQCFRKSPGEESTTTVRAYNNLALNLNAQGKYAIAEGLLKKALAICRKVAGEDNPDTAILYNSLALNLDAQGRWAAAHPLFQQALAINRKVLGEEHLNTARYYFNLALNLTHQGQYPAAEPLYHRAVDIAGKIVGQEHPFLGLYYNGLATNLDMERKHQLAEPVFRKALAITRKAWGEDNLQTALSYNNLGVNLDAQGKPAEAEPLHRRALATWRKVLGEDHPKTAHARADLAFCLNAQGKFTVAEPLLRKALAVRRRTLGEDHPDTALGWTILGANLNAQGRYAEAESIWTRAADAFNRGRLRIASSGLGRAQTTMDRTPDLALAAVLIRNGKPAEAWQRFEESLSRGTWDDLSARLRRSAADRDRRTALVASLNRLDQLIERTLAAKDTPELKRRREDLLTQRRQQQAELDAFAARLEKQYGPVAGQVYDQATIQAALPLDAALVGWIDLKTQPKAADPNGEHWAVVLRARGAPIWVRLAGSGPKGAWTAADMHLPGDLPFARPDPSRPWQGPADRMGKQRLQPLAAPLGAHDGLPPVRQLIILPSAAMVGVPLEVCTKSYTISYAPSGTLFAYLRRRPQTAARGLLALADPVFETGQPKDGQLLVQRRGADNDEWPALPGTRVEAEALGRLCRAANQPFRLLSDSQASEQELDRLARSKELAGYRYVHLATHGIFDDRRPLQSAVILSRDHLPDPVTQLEAGQPVYDGRLTAESVLERWDLHADLVTLSACETALGKYEGGEGFVGFTQALLLSGARSVCLGLWRVDDTATALLMQRFYANLLGQRPGPRKPLGKAEALAEAKKWLRQLSAEDAARQAVTLRRGVARGKGRKPLPTPPAVKSATPYAHPYYWAAFVLVGDPD
jgi:CHAT domain-containing protein/tetratricopeptide (TPR) repeat protein